MLFYLFIFFFLIKESVLHVLFHSSRKIVKRVNILGGISKYNSNFLTRDQTVMPVKILSEIESVYKNM